MNAPSRKTNCIRLVIAVIFISALILGPGPGAHLVDGQADQPRFLFGTPLLYLWLVFWALVMAACVLTLALSVWKEEKD